MLEKFIVLSFVRKNKTDFFLKIIDSVGTIEECEEISKHFLNTRRSDNFKTFCGDSSSVFLLSDEPEYKDKVYLDQMDDCFTKETKEIEELKKNLENSKQMEDKKDIITRIVNFFNYLTDLKTLKEKYKLIKNKKDIVGNIILESLKDDVEFLNKHLKNFNFTLEQFKEKFTQTNETLEVLEDKLYDVMKKFYNIDIIGLTK